MLLFFSVACGSSDNSGGAAGASSGGSTATAGSSSVGGASSSAGGSGTAGVSGTAVEGGISINLQAGAGCALMAQYLDFPIVAGDHPVTGTAESAGIENQEPDSNGAPALVSCHWFTDTAPFMVESGITLGSTSKVRTVSLGSDFPSGVGETSQGTLIIQVPELPDESGYSASCTFTTIKVDSTTRSVWGSFTCDSFMDSTNTATQCSVGPSYFYYKNCTKN